MQHTCSNCGQVLSEENIRLAMEDLGGDVAEDKITFCCPGYTDDKGCPGYGRDDRSEMAYWYTIG